MSFNLDDYVSLIIAGVIVLYTIASILRTVMLERKPLPPQGQDEKQKPAAPVRPPPKAPPKPVAVRRAEEKYSFRTNIEDYTQKTAIDDRHLTIHLRSPDELVSDAFRIDSQEGALLKKKSKSSIQQLIKSLPQEKLLFLSYEVFHVPVSKRPSPFPWNG